MWKPIPAEELNKNCGCENCTHDSKLSHEEPCAMCNKNGVNNTVCYYNAEWIDTEAVNHPDHYNREGGMECIDEMVAAFGIKAVMNFCLCNVWKYRYRAEQKNGNEDFEKSNWYMNKYVELKERL